MKEKEKSIVMLATIQSVKDLIQKRMSKRLETLNTLETASSTLDNLPESVKVKREEEASKIRAVLQEQNDIIDILNMLFPPNGQAG